MLILLSALRSNMNLRTEGGKKMQLVQHYLGLPDILVWSRIKAILEGKAKNSDVFLKTRGSKQKI